MTKEEIIEQFDLEDDLVFLEESNIFNKGIIGVSSDNLHIVYDYEKLVEALVGSGLSEEDARDTLDYNTLPSAPQMGKCHPIIIFPLIEN